VALVLRTFAQSSTFNIANILNITSTKDFKKCTFCNVIFMFNMPCVIVVDSLKHETVIVHVQ